MKPYIQRQAIVNLTLSMPAGETAESPSLENAEKPAINGLLEQVSRDQGLDKEQKDDLKAVVQNFRTVFSNRPGRSTVVAHDTELCSDHTIRSKPYRLSPSQRNYGCGGQAHVRACGGYSLQE